MSSDVDMDALAALGIDDCLAGSKSKQQVDLGSILLSLELENDKSIFDVEDIFNEIEDSNRQTGTFEVELTKNARGFGFAIVKKDEDGKFYIKELIREPALTDGRLKAGDQILSVNDCDITSYSHSEAIEFLRAQPKTIKLFLRRLTDKSLLELGKPKIRLPIITKTNQDELEEDFSQADSSCSIFSSTSQQRPMRDASTSDSFDDEDYSELDISGRFYKSVSRDSSSPSASSPSTIGRTSSCSSRIRSQLRPEALMFVLEKSNQRQSGASDNSLPSRKKLNRSHNQSRNDLSENSSTNFDSSTSLTKSSASP